MVIFQKLSGGPMAVHELAQQLPVSRPAVSQHLKVLKEAGLVNDSRAGTRRVYRLSPEGVARLRTHFDQLWVKEMSAFKDIAEDQHRGGRHGKSSGRNKRHGVQERARENVG
jgi:DNA-binding transcriptional ArsR family regulator